MRTLRYPKPAKRAPKPPRPIPRGKRPRVRMPSAAGDYRSRLKYGLDLWRKLVYAKEPSGVCPCCLKREWHDAAHCFAKGPYRSLCLEPSNGAPLCRPCHRRIDSDHHAKQQFFTAYIGPAEYERLRLLAMSRSKMDLGLTLLLLEDMTRRG